jgi:hypothetical protein
MAFSNKLQHSSNLSSAMKWSSNIPVGHSVWVGLSISPSRNAALASTMQNFCIGRLIRAKKLYEYAFQIHLQESCDVTILYSLALMNKNLV